MCIYSCRCNNEIFESGGLITGGVDTGGVETLSEEEKEGEESKTDVEAKRWEVLHDTHFKSIDVYVTGEDGAYCMVIDES